MARLMSEFKPSLNVSPPPIIPKIHRRLGMVVMNLARMVKMFDWEKKVEAQVEGKREEEPHWYKKSRLLGLLNNNIKYVGYAYILIQRLM